MAHLPHLAPFHRQPILFLTVCAHERRPILASPAVHDILRKIWLDSASRNGWCVGRYVVMPDHVHLFAQAALDARPLPDWRRLWKSISSRRINLARQSAEPVWQADYFDRFLRTSESYRQKWEYVALNPVRKGLVESIETWEFGGEIFELRG